MRGARRECAARPLDPGDLSKRRRLTLPYEPPAQRAGKATEPAFDLIVLGSGIAGLTAALTASLAGATVLIIERDALFGGTSARSSGTVWMPDSPYLREAGVTGDRRAAERYLSGLVGARAPASHWQRLLDAGPVMLDELRRSAGVGFRPFMQAPDYRQDIEGAALGGRALEPLPFDGRLLGDDFVRLRAPIPELMLFGGMMLTRAEASELLRADRSASAMALAARLCGRYLRDRLQHARGTRLVMGNALTARLWHAARAHGAVLWTGRCCQSLVVTEGRVVGARMADDQGEDSAGRGSPPPVVGARATVLAGGGFPASAEWRERHLPKPLAVHTPAAPGCDGSSIALGLAAGGTLGESGLDNALWFPSSIRQRADGKTAVYPHIVLDRGKPGLIAVDSHGRRFVDEAVSYHEFVRAMYARDAVPAWLVCDRRFIARYGLGLIRPRTPSLRRHVASGYLHEAATITALADTIGVSADQLRRTVERHNEFARHGVDADFGKGSNVYDRAAGDPRVRPNPCLGPIRSAPFYALAVHPTPLGTSLGLRADDNGRVLAGNGSPVDGLYVCGNDMQSAFGGEYPGAGGQLAQAMTFGWLAARHALGQPFDPDRRAQPVTPDANDRTTRRPRTGAQA
ncbi:MAG: FAD-dependent oxidoreductase [Burkholderiaceae bacterium]